MKKKTIIDFNDQLASKEAIPGGGGASALCAAMAAALAEMVTNLTYGKKKYIEYSTELKDIRNEAEILRNNLLDCIQKDADSFIPLAKAYSMDKNSPNYQIELEKCLHEAAKTPLLIAKYAARIIDLDERLAVIGSKLSVSDVASSLMISYGSLKAAIVNVKVNTRLMKDKTVANEFEKECSLLEEEYEPKIKTIYDSILERL